MATALCLGCFSEVIRFSDTPSTLPRNEQWKEALIVDLLSRTPELNIHRMNGQSDNQVYTHEDGREAVYDGNDSLVTDPVNQGSYNYYHAVDRPLAHFAKDIHPWIKWGNARGDPSTRDQRISAYMKDLRLGISAALHTRSIEIGETSMQFTSKTERAVVRLFLRAITATRDDALFDMYENPENATEERLDQFLEALEPQLRKTL